MNKKMVPPMIGTIISTLLLIFVGIEGTGRVGFDPRNIALANLLASCPSRDIVGGDVRVGYAINGNIVFDVRSCAGESRLIDPLHLLFQFGHKIKEHSFTRLSIASAGQEIYYLEKSDLAELAHQYELGARIWAFDHWTERLRKPDGDRAYGSWSGGFLGVMKGQMEDLNEALKTWLQKATTL